MVLHGRNRRLRLPHLHPSENQEIARVIQHLAHLPASHSHRGLQGSAELWHGARPWLQNSDRLLFGGFEFGAPAYAQGSTLTLACIDPEGRGKKYKIEPASSWTFALGINPNLPLQTRMAMDGKRAGLPSLVVSGIGWL